MGATTNHELPWPENTAAVKDGAAAIRALAEAIDARLSGALFVADVATEAIPDAADDLLNLTLDDAQTSSGIFDNSGALHIEYLGTPTVIATVFASVGWEGDAAGTRRIRLLKNDSSFHTSRVTPDADALTQSTSWPVSLATGDILSLQVWQNSGGALDVTAAQFRCLVAGIAPA